MILSMQATGDDDQTQRAGFGKERRQVLSPEELLRAYKTAENQNWRRPERRDYRRVLNQWGTNAGLLLRRADEEAFIQEMRKSFEKDPVAATAMMIKRFQEGSRQEVEARIEEAVRDQGEFRRLFEDFLADPANHADQTGTRRNWSI